MNTDSKAAVRRLNNALGIDLYALLTRPSVNELILNSDGRIFIEDAKNGMAETALMIPYGRADLFIRTAADLLKLPVSDGCPVVSGKLPGISARIEALLPPITRAPSFSIRKHTENVLTLNELSDRGMLTESQLKEVREILSKRLNTVICGTTGSGKTTFLNALLCEIALSSPDERVISIEDTEELKLTMKNHLCLYTAKDADMSLLLRSSLRLRPQRLVVGEIRGQEALDMLDIYCTGHKGGLSTMHAGDRAEALNRLELMAGRHPKAPKNLSALIKDALDCLIILKPYPQRQIDSIIYLKNL